jgi:hypothetical protein
MAIVSFNQLGSMGVVYDSHPAELTPQVWSDGRNIRFYDNAVQSRRQDLTLELSQGGKYLIPLGRTGSGLSTWVLVGNGKIHAYEGDDMWQLQGVTPVDPLNGRWSGAFLGGVLVLNNGDGPPICWTDTNPGTLLKPLPFWPSGATANCLRAYKQYLVALDIVQNGQHLPTTVLWSHPADPGSVPPSWNIADPTHDAGEAHLSETGGTLLDCCTLKDVNVLYKDDSVWGMQYVGGTFVFRFYKMFGDFGIGNRDCVVEFLPGQHFVFTGRDLIVHNGQEYRSVVNGRMRNIVRKMSPKQIENSFVMTNPQYDEVWFCYPSVDNLDNGIVDTAIVWNWGNDTLVLNDLTMGMTFGASGWVTDPIVDVLRWMDAPEPWDAHLEPWGAPKVMPGAFQALALAGNSFIKIEGGAQTKEAFVERRDYGIPAAANQPPDPAIRKFISRFYPRFSGQPGDMFQMKFGVSDVIDKPPVWVKEATFTMDSDLSVPTIMTGRYIHQRVEVHPQSDWKYNGVDLEVRPAGRWIDGLQ